MHMAGSTFLTIPVELRLLILHFFLFYHKRVREHLQPSSTHLRLSHVCSQLRKEVLGLADFKHYVSLQHEQQIQFYLDNIENENLLRVRHIDVANDGRMVLNPITDQILPVSRLYLILSRLPALECLRVFDCRRARSLNDFIPNIHVVWDFERSLYPLQFPSHLQSYELFVGSTTKVSVDRNMLSVKRLRLSGTIFMAHVPCPLKLNQLSICGVTGNFLDKNSKRVTEALESLQVFRYSQGDRLGFEMHDSFLRSLVSTVGPNLHTLVLLGCSKLSTATLKDCLWDLSSLEYFALSLVAYEFSDNFLVALPSSTKALKLKITNGKFANPYIREENAICTYIHDVICCRRPLPQYIHLDFRPEVITRYAGGMTQRARAGGSTMRFGEWDKDEDM